MERHASLMQATLRDSFVELREITIKQVVRDFQPPAAPLPPPRCHRYASRARIWML